MRGVQGLRPRCCDIGGIAVATTTVRPNPSRLYDQADQFADALETRQQAAADQMLAAWTDSYWAIRQELDGLMDRMAAAKAEGVTFSPSWLYRQARLSALMGTVARETTRYALAASQVTVQAQQAAIHGSATDAAALTATAMAETAAPVGAGVTVVDVDPAALVAELVGFMGDDTVLTKHLAKTLVPEAQAQVKSALLAGITRGKSQDWMIREATKGLALTHVRAETIMRTESLRVYRETARRTYEANSDVLVGWVWDAHLDRRTCLACTLMDGTVHPLTTTLDGHPRCRCAPLPRTKTWAEMGLDPALDLLGDTRPPIRSGKTWLEAQSPSVQRELMGPLKFDAWKAGDITLDDMVARHSDPDWGTMRTVRSMVAIREGRHANFRDA
jgi:SPP1 gp7 family putative phage head morphogenesis protein